MAMGKRLTRRQEEFWIATTEIPTTPGHPFYRKLNEILDAHGFDDFAEDLCRRYYAEKMGRPSLPQTFRRRRWRVRPDVLDAIPYLS